MGPESRVVPSLSCVIERFSNHSCQKVSRCPFTRMMYLMHLCSIWMTFRHSISEGFPTRTLSVKIVLSQQVDYSSQKDTLRILSHWRGAARREVQMVAKRIVPKSMECSDIVLMELPAGFFGSKQFIR